MQVKNKFNMTLLSRSSNESFARACVSAFAAQLDPTIEEINDIKTAVSEAVTNAIVHGYPDSVGDIEMTAEIIDSVLHIKIKDTGVGIENLEKALEPFYTTKLEDERSGMGFTIMKTFMDDVVVKSSLNQGTVVSMTKRLSLGQ